MHTLKNYRLARIVTFLIVIVFISVAAATPFLPDYETYRSIYETGGGHLTVLGRDLGFVFLVQLLSPIVGYNNFRWLLLIIIAGVLIFSLRKLQLSSSKRLGVSLVMALVPLILLKFGAQIREGIALLIWLSIIFTNNRRPSWLIFTPVALISVSIHLATLPLWMLLGLNYYLPNRPTLALVLGALLYAAFTYLVADISRLNEELFRGLSQDSVNPNLFTAAYWLFYPLVFFSSIFRSNPVNSNQAGGGIPFIALDFVLRAAMIGFLVGITLQVGLTGQAFFVKGAVADSIRLAALLLSLYCISLAARGRHRYATLLALFLIVDTIRIMLAA